MKRMIASGCVLAALALAAPVEAADMPVKAVPAPLVDELRYYFEFSGLAMTRSKSRDVPIFSSAAAPGSGDIFRAGQFDPGWAGGVESRLGFRKGRWGAEFGFFWLGTMDESIGFPNTQGIANAFIETVPRTGYGLAGARLDFASQSHVMGVEANGTFDAWRGVTLLAGARFLKLNDDFNIVGTTILTGVSFENDGWTARNAMIGGQIGARVDVLDAFGHAGSPWIVEANLRAGVFDNQTETTSRRDATLLFRSTDDHLAYAAQGGIGVGYRVNPNISILAAYDALWLGRVALATTQVGQTPRFGSFPNGSPMLGIATEDVLYQGVKLTLRIHN